MSTIRPAALVSSQAAEVVEAACDLVTASLSGVCLGKTTVDELVYHYMDLVIKRKEAECYEAAARMIGRLSELRPANKEIDRCVWFDTGADETADQQLDGDDWFTATDSTTGRDAHTGPCQIRPVPGALEANLPDAVVPARRRRQSMIALCMT